ncbi:MAG: xanthine dehydrogenase family protein molybdopterin-binding subunit, partial [Acidimicrobiia bacterium]
VTRVVTAAAEAHPGVVAVLTGDDPELRQVVLRASSRLKTYVETAQPVLAWEKVRYAGEAVVAVVAVDRATAEDGAELVEVDYEPLPVVVDVLGAGGSDGGVSSVPLHEEAPDNVLIRRRFERGDVDAALAGAALLVERSLRTNRVTASPMEGRGGLAEWSDADDRMVLWSGTQVPHVARHFLAELLGLAESRLRVVAPDVGGGFGVKAAIYPEDVVLCVLARRLRVPVRFLEDRLEGLLTDTHARDHAYEVTAGFDSDGRLVGLRARVSCNVGAYSIVPWTCGIEVLMAGGLLMGPYRLEHYRCDALGVATNTTPAGPYRGVARPSTVFVMERILDQAARELGLDPVEIRARNLVLPEDLPYVSASGLVHDSPSYLAVLERILELSGYQELRADQARLRIEGRYVGIGLACYNELTGLGRATPAGPGLPFRTGHDAVMVRMDPGGAVTVVAGATSQGQGLETTIAQVVAAELGVAFEDVDVRLGDTDAGVWGMGAFSSRQGVITGGAAALAARALRAKVMAVAAHLLEVSPDDLEVGEGRVFPKDAPTKGLPMAEVGRVAYLATERLPADLDPGLEATRFYDPIRGTFAAGAQLAVVEVNPQTGMLDIHSYW